MFVWGKIARKSFQCDQVLKVFPIFIPRHPRKARQCQGHRGIGRRLTHRRLLLGARSPVAAQFDLKVQGHRGRSAAPPVAARVPQRVAARRCTKTVSDRMGFVRVGYGYK